MANRFLLKEFASNATNTGVFGSYQQGNPTYSTDPEQIQSLPAWLTGWLDATTGGTYLPRLEEMQGLQKVLCQAIVENYREGVPQWLSTETYYKDSVVSYSDSSSAFALYYNITGGYTATPPSQDTTNWANLSGLFVTKEYVDNTFLGVNRVTGGLLAAQDNSSYQNQTTAVSYINHGATVTNQVVSNFGSFASVMLTKPFPTSTNWEIRFSFIAPDVTTQQVLVAAPILTDSVGIMNGYLYLSLAGNVTLSNVEINPNVKYYFRVTFNGTQYVALISSDNVNYTQCLSVASSQQPWGGKTITLGNGGVDYPHNYFTGQMDLAHAVITSNAATYWNLSTTTTAYVIHFNGNYTALAPNGRDVNNNLNNATYTYGLNQYMNYNLINGTKTLFLTQNGELMARAKYTESATQPASGNMLDVWFNPNTNIMYDFSSQQPNFTNTGLNVNLGVVSGWGAGKNITINENIGTDFDLRLSVNTGTDVTTLATWYTWGSNSLTVESGNINANISVQSYQVAINTGTSEEPVYENIKYVPFTGTAFVDSGTTLYSDVICGTEDGTATGTDYVYTGEIGTDTITCTLPIETIQNYVVEVSYIGGNYMLKIGSTMNEVTAAAATIPASSIILGGGVLSGTANLANIEVGSWTWNGVSTVSTTWNKIVAARIGTVTDNGSAITSLNIDEPIQLAKQTDLATFKQETDSRIINITDTLNNKFQVVPMLPSNPNPNVFYFIPEA